MIRVGDVFVNTHGTMVLLVISRSPLSARCVVIWASEEVTTAYRVGEVDSWSVSLISDHWKRV